MKKYFLIGAPYCGKTTLGRKVAKILELPFFDTDVMIKEKNRDCISIMRFDAHFRIEQEKVIAKLAESEDSAIVATGAEVALIPDCVELMQNAGVIIHIKRNVDTILEELKSAPDPRLVWEEVNTGRVLDVREQTVLAYASEIQHYEAVADYNLDNNKGEDHGVELLSIIINGLLL